MSAYNSLYYLKNKEKSPGHIATCYPDENKEKEDEMKKRVVQGGARTGVLQWNGYTNIHIYLGYILIK